VREESQGILVATCELQKDAIDMLLDNRPRWQPPDSKNLSFFSSSKLSIFHFIRFHAFDETEFMYLLEHLYP
jgi:hypothetical protein